MTKPVKEMTDAELVQAYRKGRAWLIDSEQVSKTDKNKAGRPYDPALYMAGLTRLEEIEKEMLKRGING